MATEAQIHANRENSTGPDTEITEANWRLAAAPPSKLNSPTSRRKTRCSTNPLKKLADLSNQPGLTPIVR